MESWMISLGIGLITYVSVFVTIKNKTEQNSKDIVKVEKELKDEVSGLKSDASSHKKEDVDMYAIGLKYSKLVNLKLNLNEY